MRHSLRCCCTASVSTTLSKLQHDHNQLLYLLETGQVPADTGGFEALLTNYSRALQWMEDEGVEPFGEAEV